MTLLLVGHLPTDPPEATLVLAAAGMCNGFLRDGSPSGGIPRAPSLRELARILGIHVDAVRRGVRHLQAAGEARMDGGVRVEPEALRRRWHDARDVGGARRPARWFRVRITAELCRLGLTPRPLLLAGLIAGLFDDRRDELRLAIPFLAERLGLPLRTVERLVVACERAGALHTWTRPVQGGGFRRLKLWKPGPSPSSGGGRDHRPVTVGPSSGGGRDHRPVTVGPSSGGGHLPECLPEATGSTARNARAREGPGRTANAEQSAEVPTSDRVASVARALLATRYRSQLEPEARERECWKRAVLLQPTAITAEQVPKLLALCEATPGVRDADGLFSALIDRGVWIQFVDRHGSLDRHRDALRRGAVTRAAEIRDGPYGGAPLVAASELLDAVLAQVKHA